MLVWLCGSITYGVCTCALFGEVYWTAVQHTFPHRTHTHTPNVMLPHHHIDFFTLLTNFKIGDFNKEHTSSLKMI